MRRKNKKGGKSMRRQRIDIPACEQMAIERAGIEEKRVYFITSRFRARKCKDNYSCIELQPCVGNEELVFTLTPLQETLLRGIANYETIEDMNQKVADCSPWW